MHCSKKCLFDHLVGGIQQAMWHVEAQGVGGLEVDRQCITQWCLDRQISRIVPFENPGDISTSIAKLVDEVDTIGN